MYRLFSSKRGILKELFNVSIAGDDEAVPLEDRPHVQALISDPDPRKQLSGFVGISRENINRQLAAWASEGVIELTQGKIRIIDPDYLTQLAEAAD